MQKKEQLIQKHPGICSICRCLEKKSFYKNVSDLTSFSQNLGLFFFRTLIPLILFPETVLSAPIDYLGTKSPRNLKLRTFFQWHFDFGKLGLFYHSFYFQVFFQKLVFRFSARVTELGPMKIKPTFVDFREEL